jgi:hypothetical protein
VNGVVTFGPYVGDPLVVLCRTEPPFRPVVLSRRASVEIETHRNVRRNGLDPLLYGRHAFDVGTTDWSVTVDVPRWPRRLRVGEIRDVVVVPRRGEPVGPDNPRITGRVRVEFAVDRREPATIRLVGLRWPLARVGSV